MRPLVQIIFIVIALTALGDPSGAMAADAPTNYRFYCVQCHGTQGDGKGINTTAEALTVTPQNHRDAKSMGAHSDDEFRKAITNGGEALAESHLMPPWTGVLTAAEIEALIVYLRKLCACTYNPTAKHPPQ